MNRLNFALQLAEVFQNPCTHIHKDLPDFKIHLQRAERRRVRKTLEYRIKGLQFGIPNDSCQALCCTFTVKNEGLYKTNDEHF